MKIAIFSDNFYPELSGIADSIIALAKELASRGHQINFYVPKYSVKNFQQTKLPVREIDLAKNISVKRFFSLPFPGPTEQTRLVLPTALRWLKIKKFKPELIHSQLFFGVGLEALMTAKFLKIPIIGTNHTAITEFVRYSPIKSERFKKLSLQYAIWYYNQCDFVTAPSESVFQEMMANSFNKPHQVISNPIDLKTFKPALNKEEKQKIKKQYNLSADNIIYAGRLAKEKNLEVIIKAVTLIKKQLPKINLLLAGHGSSAPDLKKLTRQLKLEKQIRFLGTVDKPTLAKLYNVSEIFIITSTSETQSMTLMQAFACGLPAIGVKARALPEYINEQNGLLVEPGDYKTLAEKIIYLLENQAIRQKLSQGALTFVQQFSAQNIAKKWEELYQRVRQKSLA